MIHLDSPKDMALDGTLVAWGAWVVTHFAEGIMWALTAGILLLRLLILYRQWRAGK